jgi:trehalose synthase
MSTEATLKRVSIGRHYGAQSTTLEAYKTLVGEALLDELQTLARGLNGVRICHVNSSAAGGGVAEILAREIPLLRSLGITADWQVIRADEEFFTVTKALHNAMHGGRFRLGPEWKTVYLEQTRASAEALPGEYDVYVVHDPQPAPLCQFRRRQGERWIWRSHIDSSTPDPEVWAFLKPLVEEYDGAVFTLKDFVPDDLTIRHIDFVPPAIDPLSSRNMDVPMDLCRRAVADLGVDLTRPILLQVSRFDPWKDPLGVIEAYRRARREVPGIQLVLAGMLAPDDPEGQRILDRVEDEAGNDPDIFVLTNLGNMEVNVFQRSADVVIQKSLKEGFGLVVTEALWKAKPVVAGGVGGIPMQVPTEYQEFLVDSIEDCATKVVTLLRDPDRRAAFGDAGRRHVREHFLLPRLARDDLRVVRAVLDG